MSAVDQSSPDLSLLKTALGKFSSAPLKRRDWDKFHSSVVHFCDCARLTPSIWQEIERRSRLVEEHCSGKSEFSQSRKAVLQVLRTAESKRIFHDSRMRRRLSGKTTVRPVLLETVERIRDELLDLLHWHRRWTVEKSGHAPADDDHFVRTVEAWRKVCQRIRRNFGPLHPDGCWWLSRAEEFRDEFVPGMGDDDDEGILQIHHREMIDAAQGILNSVNDRASAVAALDSRDERVILKSPGESPIIDGTEVHKLTKAQYDVVQALLAAGPQGLTKDELDRNSKHGDARKILARLKEQPGWDAVIQMPGSTGMRYRLKFK
jgi:hypothetical protein